MYDSSPKVDSDSHIPDSILGDINRQMYELYVDLLQEISTLKLGLRIKDTSGMKVTWAAVQVAKDGLFWMYPVIK